MDTVSGAAVKPAVLRIKAFLVHCREGKAETVTGINNGGHTEG